MLLLFSDIGRIFWGWLGDCIGISNTLMLLALLFSIVLATFPLSVHFDKLAFALWTFTVFLCEGEKVYIDM